MAFVLTRPVTPSGGGSGVTGLTITTINGQPMLTLVDSTRSDKILSIAEHPVSWDDNRINLLDWIRIGNANDATSAYVTDFDGTIVTATAQCENVRNNDKIIHLFINNTNKGPIGTLSSPNADTFVNTALNIDFNQGDQIRLQALDGSSGRIEDTVIKLILKWRG